MSDCQLVRHSPLNGCKIDDGSVRITANRSPGRYKIYLMKPANKSDTYLWEMAGHSVEATNDGRPCSLACVYKIATDDQMISVHNLLLVAIITLAKKN